PKGWAIGRIDSVVRIINGKSQKDVESHSGAYPIYGSGGIIGRANEYLCPAGSTVIGRKGTINNPIYVKEQFWNVDTAFGIKPSEAVNDLYFYYFCLLFDFSKLDKSTALPSLTKTAIGNLILPIPPYQEQCRIIEAINKYNQIFDKIMESL
ncbi:restriction endonuclease subunit S, partial [Bacteroides fragilis]